MLRHIVLFRLQKELEVPLRMKAMADFKAGIMALPPQIHEIRYVEVGLNVNKNETWDICLLADFDNLNAMRAYASHPAHVAVAGALKPYLNSRSCVDYEF